MKPSWRYVAVLAVAVWMVKSEDTGLTCQNGGTCADESGDSCISCSCALGYTGNDCGVVLAKVIGSISYNSSLSADTNSSRPIFNNDVQIHNRLSAIFDGYENSTVEKYNSNTSISVINFVVYIQRPSDRHSFNATAFRATHEPKLRKAATTSATFQNTTGIVVYSASVDVNECASQLFTCTENAECYNTDTGYGCTCKDGFSGDNSTSCLELFCLLSQAPSRPASAARTITYPDGVVSSTNDRDRVPAKTFIEYKCPDRYVLVNAATGKAEANVIECAGSNQPTPGATGWMGNDERCDMTVEYMVAIIMAAVSCVIIVLIGGAFIVAHDKKKKRNAQPDLDELEMDDSHTNISSY